MKKLIAGIICSILATTCSAQNIAVLSDIHVTPGSIREQKLAEAVDEINLIEYDLVIVNGDLTNEGSDEQLRNVKALLDKIERPLYVLPGNHENNWSQSATKTFLDLWGDDRFAVVKDSLLIVGINCGPYMKMGDGHVKQEDLQWLENTLNSELKPGMKVISCNHYPIRKDDIDNYQRYEALLQNYPVILHINGHYHSWDTYCIGKVPGVMIRALLMGKDNYDFGYTVVKVESDKIRIEEKKLGESPSLKYIFDQDYSHDCKDSDVETYERIDDDNCVWTDSASIFTRLAFDDKRVYFGNSLGASKAIDKYTGEIVWQNVLTDAIPLFSRATLLSNKCVAVPTTSGISILNTSDGRIVEEILSEDGPYVADGILTLDGEYIQGGFKRIDRWASDPIKLIWTYDSIGNYCQAAPAIDENVVVFGAWDTYLRCLDINSGEILWKWNNGTNNNMTGPGNVVPVLTEDKVIIVAPDRYITAIDRNSGLQIWRDNSYKYRESLGHSEDMTKVYAKTMDGEIVAVDTRSKEFKVVWVTDMGIGYDHAPCVIAEKNDVIYVGSRRGIISALNAYDGKLMWQKKYGISEVNGIDIDPYDGSVWASLVEGKIIKLVP